MNNSTVSFREKLKNMLITHSVKPALGVLVICAASVLLFGSIYFSLKNNFVNRRIAQELELVTESFGTMLTELESMEGIAGQKISTTKRQVIVKKLYTTTVATGIDADIFVLDADNDVMLSTDEEVSEEEKLTIARKWEILYSLREFPGELAITASHGSNRQLFIGKALQKEEGYSGCIVVTISESELSKLYSDHSQKTVIVRPDSWILAENSRAFSDAISKIHTKLRDYKGFRMYEKGLYHETYTKLSNGFSVYTFTDITELTAIMLTVFVTAVIVLFVIAIVNRKSAERMAIEATVDLYSLNDAFKEVAKGNLDTQTDLHSSREFEEISDYFRFMLESLKNQIEKNWELAQLVAEEQYKQLGTQFSSHFLFNTLDNIRYICRLDPALAEEMTVSLSELLRYSTSNRNEKVTVDEDMEYTKLYFKILEVRFGDRFSYDISVSEEAEECLTPKLLIQPLIENSVKYVFRVRSEMKLMVCVRLERKNLVFECRDDGPGINSELLEKISANLEKDENTTAHLGLYNVHRRIRLAYGSGYGITLKNCGGLVATATIAAEYEDGTKG